MNTVAERLAEWVHGLTARDIPAEALSQAKRCIVDVTGVALAGAAHDTSRKVRALAQSASASGSATVWGANVPALAAAAAALCNATSAHVLDYDDTCYDGIVHGSAAVWPAVLACAETAAASGARVLEAFVAGVEAEYAIGRALSDRVYFNGWWTSGVFGSIGAAAGAAKMLGLDAVQTCHAISLAMCQATGVRAMIGTAAKPYALGRAAQAGVQAALFARAGLDAPRDAFESERGFVQVFAARKFDASKLALGRRYSLIEPGIAFKLYPACSAAQAATEAVLELVKAHDIAPKDVISVECEVTPLVAISLMYDRPTSVTEAQFSLPYAIACALRYRDFGVRRMNEPSFTDAETLALMQNVRMLRDDELESTEESRRDNPEGARVTLKLNDGRLLMLYKGAATGMPSKPMPDDALDRKFRECASTVLAASEVEARLGKLRSLERCEDVRGLLPS